MRFWLVKLGEPLPTDAPDPRLLRTGLLAGMLAKRGHEVTWWTSSLDHVTKRQRASRSITLRAEGYDIRVLHGPAYRRNVSLRRVLHHRAVADALRGEALRVAPPDMVLSAYPAVEVAAAAVAAARSLGRPVLLDIRDMWPDIFLEMAPGPLRPLARALLEPNYRLAARAMRGATALTGITAEAIAWARRLSGTPPSPLDRPFHLATLVREPLPAQLQETSRDWDARGVVGWPGQFVVTYVGTMSHRIDLETVIRAARRVLAGTPSDVRFVLCGVGDRLEALRRVAGDLPQVIFPGFVSAASIRVLLRRSAVGLLPYPPTVDFAMSVPNKVGEYLSAGLLVVSSAPGITERLLREEGCGVTYRTGDGEGLARALLAVMRDPALRTRMGKAAARVFGERFDAGVVYGEFCDHLERLARDHAGTR